MIVSYKFENFRSFRNLQELSFVPESFKEVRNNLCVCYKYDATFLLQKSLAIYGYNAFGKSNTIKSLEFFIDTILNSYTTKSNSELIAVNHFKLNNFSKFQPSSFQVIVLLGSIKLRYRFDIINGIVDSEELYYSEPKIRENYLFLRKGEEVRVSKIWHKEFRKIIDESLFRIKPHYLLLSILISGRELPMYINELYNWLKDIILVPDVRESSYMDGAIKIYANPKYRSTIQSFISAADLGFESIFSKILEISQNVTEVEFNSLLFNINVKDFDLYTRHKLFDIEGKQVDTILFDLMKDESAGSIKLFFLTCYLAKAIEDGNLIVVDEIDSKLHPELLSTLLTVFHEKSIGSQLYFTVHNTNLISYRKGIVRRDQIYIVDKNELGESNLARMHTSSNPIRNDQDMEKEYLKGKFKGTKSQLKLDL